MRRLMPYLLCLCAAAVAPGQDQEKASGKVSAQLDDPREILKKAQAAMSKTKAVSYNVRYRGTRWIETYVSAAEGSVMLGELSEHDIPRFRCEIKLTAPGVKESVELTAGSDGDLYYLIDKKNKTVYADIDEAVLGASNRDAQRVLMREFVAKEPLAEALKVETIELKPSEKVGDQDCYQVSIVRPERGETRLFVSKQDWLPRKVVRVYKDPERGEGSTVLELNDLIAETKCDLKKFKLVVPKGFKKTDDFAP